MGNGGESARRHIPLERPVTHRQSGHGAEAAPLPPVLIKRDQKCLWRHEHVLRCRVAPTASDQKRAWGHRGGHAVRNVERSAPGAQRRSLATSRWTQNFLYFSVKNLIYLPHKCPKRWKKK